jgi:type I restriction enzyme S subunit
MFPITVPRDIDEQRAIAHILGSLDDKIELNRRMNETLEEMARALFRSWFVDFDPVRAKAEGRDTGLPSHIADLFPDSFEESELGEIPKGWPSTKLRDTCSAIFSGGTPITTEATYWNGDIRWLSSGETRTAFVTDTKEGVLNSSTRFASRSSTVIASAGQGKTRGQTSLLLIDAYVNQSVVVLQADHAVSSDLFLFFDLARRYEEFRRVSDSSSSRGSLTTKILSDIPVLVPPKTIVDCFERVVSPMIARIRAGCGESRTLGQLRDALLPKLISGELRVPDAERLLEAAV